MKKYQFLVLVTLFISFSTIVNAQLKVGVGAGYQSITMSFFSASDFIFNSQSAIFLPYASLSVSHPLSKKVSLSLEGDYVKGNYFRDRVSQRSRNWQELHYTLVHTSVVFRYQLGRNFSIGTGVLVYYLGPTTSRTRIVPLAEPSFVFERTFDSSISYGIPLSFGYQFKKFFLDLQWNYGFKSRERTVYGKIQTLSLGLFYQFEINKH